MRLQLLSAVLFYSTKVWVKKKKKQNNPVVPVLFYDFKYFIIQGEKQQRKY